VATYTDDANRANEAPISGGPGWAIAEGLFQFDLTNNQFVPTSGQQSGVRITSASSATHSASVRVVTGGNIGPMVRCKNAGGAKTGYAQSLSSGAIVCWRIDSDGYTNINMTGGSTTFTATDDMKLGASGSTLTGYKNGTSYGTATDATYADIYFGMWCFSGTQGVLGPNFVGDDGAAAGGAGKVIPEAMALQPMTGLY